MSKIRSKKALAALTETQQQMVRDAIGNGSTFPKFTFDPRVNHAVDVIVNNERLWDELSKDEQALYFEEIEAAKGNV